MNVADVRAELERDLTWRRDEIRHHHNVINRYLNDIPSRDRHRRALVLLLYAHFEGFCKFCLVSYIRYVNEQQPRCDALIPEVVAGAWTNVFAALENVDRKSRIFRRQLPNDSELHRFARRRDFIEEIDRLRAIPAQIDESAIDTESNLWPIVLRKNLFRVGIDDSWLVRHEGEICQLLHRRNDIAHGTDLDGMREDKYNAIQSAVFTVMEEIMQCVTDSMVNKSFLVR